MPHIPATESSLQDIPLFDDNVLAQPRILLFVHDGKGLGHLRRVCRIARALQGDCAVLIISGHRDACWLVPDVCEFVHIPSLDSLDSLRSQDWAREPFWRNGSIQGRRLRGAIIESVVKNFKPDVIIVDYLPMGKNSELYKIIQENTHAKCYLILRGVLDEPQRIDAVFFNPRARYLIENRYDRILVTADQMVVDVAAEYGFNGIITSKIIYTGYVVEPVCNEARIQARLRRRVPDSAKWVVCSAGGGVEGEELVERVINFADRFPSVYFDLILGPRSRSRINPALASKGDQILVRKQDTTLPILHAAADIVICRGGYNSLLESIQGNARVIVVPIEKSGDQRSHAVRLSNFNPISVCNLDALEQEFQITLNSGALAMTRQKLDFDGINSFRKIIFGDLISRTNRTMSKD